MIANLRFSVHEIIEIYLWLPWKLAAIKKICFLTRDYQTTETVAYSSKKTRLSLVFLSYASMANRQGSSSGSITDDQLCRSAFNRQKAKDKLSKKPGKSSDSVHCVCSSTEDVGHMVACESCCRWSHSKCVGLTASIAPSYPFVCPFCVRSLFSRLSVVESEVAV